MILVRDKEALELPAQDLRGFSEKAALVTGADSAIGRAVALQLALQGAYVVAQVQPGAAAESQRALVELSEIGTLAQLIEFDGTTTAGVGQIMAAVNESYGRLDLLVNALSTVIDPLMEASDEQRWDAIISRSLRSAWLCAVGAGDLMAGRPSPAIVNIANESEGRLPAEGVASATAAAGLSGLTANLARQLGPKTRVNCVIVRGPAGQTASGSPVPSEVARVAVYLLSADAKAVNGQTLPVGGRR